MNALVSALAISTAAPVAFAGDPSERIAALCDTIRRLDAENRADSSGEQADPPIPPAIAAAAFLANDDVRDVSAADAEAIERLGYATTYVIAAQIRDAERGTVCEISEADGVTTIRHHGPQPMTPERQARIDRLRRLLRMAERHWATCTAGAREFEARIAARDDIAMKAECELIATPARTTADMVAKVRLYETDPSRFHDGPPDADGDTLPESVMRDVIALFGGKPN